MAVGSWQLAVGSWQLAVGNWQLAVGSWQLAVGNWQLAVGFGAFPENPLSFDSSKVFRTLDRAKYGSDIFSFVTEKGWRMKVDVRWRNKPSEEKPLMIVLRNRDENIWESEAFIEDLSAAHSQGSVPIQLELLQEMT